MRARLESPVPLAPSLSGFQTQSAVPEAAAAKGGGPRCASGSLCLAHRGGPDGAAGPGSLRPRSGAVRRVRGRETKRWRRKAAKSGPCSASADRPGQGARRSALALPASRDPAGLMKAPCSQVPCANVRCIHFLSVPGTPAFYES